MIKTFDIEFLLCLCILMSFESKNIIFGFSLCVCAYLCEQYSALCISKTNKDRNTKFYTQYHTNAQIIFVGFDENRETGSGVGKPGNETESEYLKNGSNDFLQI